MPTEEDIEIATDLAHEIGHQAEGTKPSERTWIASAAHHVERLLGDATDADRVSAREHLHKIPATGTG